MAKTKHVVKGGDTLQSISNEHYGSPGMWPHIYNANTHVIATPEKLVKGQTLTIP